MFGLLAVGCCVIVTAFSLRLEDAVEGSCRGVRYKAVPHVDLDFVDSLTYIPSLNRYQLYRHASSNPRFASLREFELYYKACLTQNTTYSVGDGTTFGFGNKPLGSYTTRPRREQPSIIDTAPIVGPYEPTRPDRLQQYITLTDHVTFAFLSNCWVGSDKRSFEVYASTPDLSDSTKRMIEEHAVSIGFKRDQIVFLSYDSCGDLQQQASQDEGNFGGSLGWTQEDVKPQRNPVQIPNVELPRSGKIITSRATINPIPGNNILRRANGNLGVPPPGRLSLASSQNSGAGWRK